MQRIVRRGLRVVRDALGIERNGPPPWRRLLARDAIRWRGAIQASRDAPRVLIATSMGGFQHGAVVESALAVALTLRGASVDVLLCDSFLPACQLTEITSAPPSELVSAPPQPRCASCDRSGRRTFDQLGLRVHRYRDLVTAEERAEARREAEGVSVSDLKLMKWSGLAVGEHAIAGTLRYFARGRLAEEPAAEMIARRYLQAALLTARAAQRLLAQQRYGVAVFNHGIYVPQGVIGEVCRASGVRVVNWNPAYRRHCFVFSHDDSYHHTMLSEPSSSWESLTWSDQLERATLEYLKSRWKGTGDWIWFHDRPQEDAAAIAAEVGIDFSRPVVALLTNVMWDAQLHYASNAFADMLDWVTQTVEYFGRRPDLQLAIRAHPAEVRGMIRSRQPIVDEVRRRFPHLPGNVFLIPPESHVSTYALVERSNAAIIYGTKTGIEIASMGVPVIVAGEAWIRGKGFSLDASTAEEYFRLLDRLPLAARMPEQEVRRARKYAFHFFFRRMIPLPFVGQDGGPGLALRLPGIGELEAGHHLGLDVICAGVLTGAPFIYPAEQETSPQPAWQ